MLDFFFDQEVIKTVWECLSHGYNYNQVRNANWELQLLSLILNVSVISVIYISSARMLGRNTSKKNKLPGSPWMKKDEAVQE